MSVAAHRALAAAGGFPACFESGEQYAAWKISAIEAKEECRICDDCTLVYRVAMQAAQRCDAQHWQTVVVRERRASAKRRLAAAEVAA